MAQNNKTIALLRLVLLIPKIALVCLATSTCHSQNFVSQEAAGILYEVIKDYRHVDQPQSRYTIPARDEELVRLLVDNRQTEDAEAFIETRDHNDGLIGYIIAGRIRWLAQGLKSGISEPETEKEIVEFRRSAKLIGENFSGPILNLHFYFDKLLDTKQIGVARQIVDAIPGDVTKLVHTLGHSTATPSSLRKLRLLSKLASAELKLGNNREAKKIFDRFDVSITRDFALLTTMNNCLGEDFDIELAENCFEMIKDGQTKYWACRFIGMHFVDTKDAKSALRYAKVMSENYEQVDPSLQQHLGRLLACVAQLQISNGDSADWAIKRAEELELGLSEQTSFAAIKAIASSSSASVDPLQVFSVVIRLMDVEDSQTRQHSPFKHLSPRDRVDAAINVAKKIEHPYLRAKVISQISQMIIPIEIGKFSSLTEKSLSIFDLERSKKLATEAFQAAKKSADPIKLTQSRPVDQSSALSGVTNLFARHGNLKEMMRAVELIDNKNEKKVTINSISYNWTERDNAVFSAGNYITYSERSFTENGGTEAFQFLNQVSTFEYSITKNLFAKAIAKFAQVDSWNMAERAFKLWNESYEVSIYIPGNVIREICISEDPDRLRKWSELCPDKMMGVFLFSIGKYFNDTRTFPNQAFLIEVDSMTEAHENAGHTIPADIRKFLLIGFSIDKLKDRADSQFRKLLSEDSGPHVMSSVVSIAMANGLPDLAAKASSHSKNIMNPNWGIRSGAIKPEFEPEQLKDKKWLDSQPVLIRIAFRMRRAKELIKAAE